MSKHRQLSALEEKLSYSFKNEELLYQALTHSSYANEHKLNHLTHNERLEFLGDAVLELISSDYLYKNCPEMAEGQMSKKRAALVCEPALALCAREIRLGSYLNLGKGEDQNGGRERDSILSDAFEAVLGAMYLDGGIEPVTQLIHTTVLKDIEHADAFRDNKTVLQEMLQQVSRERISYELVSATGPEHARTFTMRVLLGDKVIGQGSGKTKQAAGQDAAYHAILSMNHKGS